VPYQDTRTPDEIADEVERALRYTLDLTQGEWSPGEREGEITSVNCALAEEVED
jgi:hypothetical protein